MGGRLGRNRAATDPFYRPVPPPATYSPSGGLSAYGPYPENGFEYVPTQTIGNLYGGPVVPRPTKYGGVYAQGLNQIPGVSPWNYGNYYLGNTTMQMMPFTMSKIAPYGQMQGMATPGGGRMMPNISAVFCPVQQSYSMPAMSCCMPPSSYSMPLSAPMMAAATPLPIAFNPLVQGMYPMASMSPVNWMTPASFMSALTTGPMPYRPPAIDFPNNVGMVMTIPYGTPNPLLSSPAYNNRSPLNSYDAQSSNAYYYQSYAPSAPSAMSPAVTYYPCPASNPQPNLAPYPAPVPVPNIQQMPVAQPVSVVASPVVANPQQPLPTPYADSLQPSQGAYINGAVSQHSVLASHYDASQHSALASHYDASQQSVTYNDSTKGSLPVYNSSDQSNSLIGQPILSSLSISSSNTGQNEGITVSKAKSRRQPVGNNETSFDRFRRYLPSIPRFSLSHHHNAYLSAPRSDPILPPILYGELISDSGWLPKDSFQETMPQPKVSKKKHKRRSSHVTENSKPLTHTHGHRVSFLTRRRRQHSGSSVSEYDCTICQQKREKRRLEEYYGSSTLSSLLSSTKETGGHRQISSNDSVPSSALYSPPTLEKENYRTHTRYPKNNKTKRKSSSSDRSTSPVILRKSPVQDPRQNMTIHEVDEEQEEEQEQEEEEEQELEVEQSERKLTDDNDSIAEKSEYQTSQMSLTSKEE